MENDDSWCSILAIHFPEGTVRHPRVLDFVEKEIGRTCAVDTGDEGVRICYSTEGNSFSEAKADSNTVATHLLVILGLSPEAITKHTVIKNIPRADEKRVRLTVVIDQHDM